MPPTHTIFSSLQAWIWAFLRSYRYIWTLIQCGTWLSLAWWKSVQWLEACSRQCSSPATVAYGWCIVPLCSICSDGFCSVSLQRLPAIARFLLSPFWPDVFWQEWLWASLCPQWLCTWSKLHQPQRSAYTAPWCRWNCWSGFRWCSCSFHRSRGSSARTSWSALWWSEICSCGSSLNPARGSCGSTRLIVIRMQSAVIISSSWVQRWRIPRCVVACFECVLFFRASLKSRSRRPIFELPT